MGVCLDHLHRRVIMFDSWRGGNPLECSSQVENVMRAWTAAEESARGIVIDALWEFEWAQNCPQQVDGSIDCGVFTILALMAWMGGRPARFRPGPNGRVPRGIGVAHARPRWPLAPDLGLAPTPSSAPCRPAVECAARREEETIALPRQPAGSSSAHPDPEPGPFLRPGVYLAL